MDAMFSAYFERGIDIGVPENLREVAGTHLGDMNLGARLVELAITDPTRTQRVDEDLLTARNLGITGVPCFVADRRIAVPGAVPPPVLAQLLAEAADRADATDD
jgi:predicted DsbA family dithiol-disulfide isomerase